VYYISICSLCGAISVASGKILAIIAQIQLLGGGESIKAWIPLAIGCLLACSVVTQEYLKQQAYGK
jgi:hypothetical protein